MKVSDEIVEYRNRLLSHKPGSGVKSQGVRYAELEAHRGDLFSIRLAVVNYWWPSKELLRDTPENLWVLVVDDTTHNGRWANHYRVGQWMFRWGIWHLNRIRNGINPLLDPDTDTFDDEDPKWSFDKDRIDELDFLPEKHE